MAEPKKTFLLTGAFSYTGRYIAMELLKQGHRVITLTNHPNPNSDYFDKIDTFPLNFDNSLVSAFEQADIFVNTYWIRFPRRSTTWETAITNSKFLFDMCKQTGIEKIVHLSVTNPSIDSKYPYFAGKAWVERLLQLTGLPYSIIRPALIFEKEDVLLNNIAHLLRIFPLFVIPGDGKYKVQPIHQEDLAKIIVEQSLSPDTSAIIDAIGPDTYTFYELINYLKQGIGSTTRLLTSPGKLRWISFACSKLLGFFRRDILLTSHEMNSLIDNLLLTDTQPKDGVSFGKWVMENGKYMGKRYIHEVRRHYRN